MQPGDVPEAPVFKALYKLVNSSPMTMGSAVSLGKRGGGVNHESTNPLMMLLHPRFQFVKITESSIVEFGVYLWVVSSYSILVFNFCVMWLANDLKQQLSFVFVGVRNAIHEFLTMSSKFHIL